MISNFDYYSMDRNEDNLEQWESFQAETDAVRHIILNYLTSQCEYSNLATDHHRASCEKFHELNRRRRKPFKGGKLIYESDLCCNVIKGVECDDQDLCKKSHTLFEIMFHPSKYRTVICNNQCLNDTKYCPFAHSREQLRLGNTYIKGNRQVVEHSMNSNFNLAEFKIVNCNTSAKHNEKLCLFYHGKTDRRRPVTKSAYSPEMCVHAEKGVFCISGDMCKRSHNRVEHFYHPERFKTKFCSYFDENMRDSINRCSYGAYCSFAHSEDEIKIDLIHTFEKNEDFFINYFKTIICPFTKSHEKSICVYSHNWQDYRRSPLKYIYKSSTCTKWDNKKMILSYEEGCQEEMNCLKCHGWKEQDFHPLNYKTRKCKDFNKVCGKNEFCPFYHANEAKR